MFLGRGLANGVSRLSRDRPGIRLPRLGTDRHEEGLRVPGLLAADEAGNALDDEVEVSARPDFRSDGSLGLAPGLAGHAPRLVPAAEAVEKLGLDGEEWAARADGKWKPRVTPTKAIEALVAERTSPAVKAALRSLLEAPMAKAGGTRGRRAAGENS